MAGCYNKTETRDRESLGDALRDVIDAARRPGVAPRYPQDAHEHAANDAILLDGLKRILRAGRVVATYVAVKR